MKTVTLLQIIVLVFGIKELRNANVYRKQQKKKWDVAAWLNSDKELIRLITVS